MKYFKIQQEILKSFEKSVDWKHIPSNWMQCIDDDAHWVTDGYVVYKIPNHFYCLSDDAIIKSFTDTLISGVKGYNIIGTLTNVIRSVDKNGKKVDCREFEIYGEDKPIFVDVKLLKYFDLEYSTFKCKSRKDPVAIYEHDELVGFAMPVYLRD